MRFTIVPQSFIILCFSLGILCLPDNAFNSNDNSTVDLPKLDPRIVNGTKAIPGQFPHQVSLRRSYTDSHFCGGSVIAEQWILTASHCMLNTYGEKILPWSMTVVAGQVLLRPNHPLSQKRNVAAIIMHPAFDRNTLTNDVALLKLKTPLMLRTRLVNAAKIGKIIPKPETVCQVSGWGYLAEEKKIVSNNLMFVSLPLISPQHCRQLLINVTHLPPGMFCAGYEEGQRDACQGDSGGGMMCGNTLSGIVSGGEGCARPKMPGLYTDVAYYRNWIDYQIKNFNDTAGNPSSRFSGKSSSSNGYSTLFSYSLVAAHALLSYLAVPFCNRG